MHNKSLLYQQCCEYYIENDTKNETEQKLYVEYIIFYKNRERQ